MKKKKVISLEQKLEALKDYIRAALYKKWLNNIVVGHIAVGDCNREGTLCSARGSNGERMQEIKKKCEYGEASEALFLWLTQQTETLHI